MSKLILGLNRFIVEKQFCQKNFFVRNITLGQKYCSKNFWVQNFWFQKTFAKKCAPNDIGSKKCLVRKKFVSKKMLGPKIFFVQNNFGSKKICVKKSFGSKKVLGQKKFWVQKSLGSKKVLGIVHSLGTAHILCNQFLTPPTP